MKINQKKIKLNNQHNKFRMVRNRNNRLSQMIK